jgi:hypothetical protein
MHQYFPGVALLYNYARMDYKNLDFAMDISGTAWSNLRWDTPEKETTAQSFKIEASVLLPIAESVSAQIGFGYAFDYLTIDSGDPIGSRKAYAVNTARKTEGRRN